MVTAVSNPSPPGSPPGPPLPPDKGEPRPKRKRSVVVITSSVLAIFVIIGGLAAIATPKFGGARTRANTRACYANQKTIAGALEMYNLDRNTRRTDLAGVAAALVSGGYLMHLPTDPGEGSDSFQNYSVEIVDWPCRVHGEDRKPDCTECRESAGPQLRCRVHGSIQETR